MSCSASPTSCRRGTEAMVNLIFFFNQFRTRNTWQVLSCRELISCAGRQETHGSSAAGEHLDIVDEAGLTQPCRNHQAGRSIGLIKRCKIVCAA